MSNSRLLNIHPSIEEFSKTVDVDMLFDEPCDIELADKSHALVQKEHLLSGASHFHVFLPDGRVVSFADERPNTATLLAALSNGEPRALPVAEAPIVADAKVESSSRSKPGFRLPSASRAKPPSSVPLTQTDLIPQVSEGTVVTTHPVVPPEVPSASGEAAQIPEIQTPVVLPVQTAPEIPTEETSLLTPPVVPITSPDVAPPLERSVPPEPTTVTHPVQDIPPPVPVQSAAPKANQQKALLLSCSRWHDAHADWYLLLAQKTTHVQTKERYLKDCAIHQRYAATLRIAAENA
jgi:hypothetical protein